jgi:hypothetical protein
MTLSLNGVDLSCMNSITGSTCREKYSNILHDSTIRFKVLTGDLLIQSAHPM